MNLDDCTFPVPLLVGQYSGATHVDVYGMTLARALHLVNSENLNERLQLASMLYDERRVGEFTMEMSEIKIFVDGPQKLLKAS